ncbi:hypothetical protein [Streptomyces pseudogriseolus]|uniref:hypothetical protein n=1 Tax=Streptomyces pseudogriseolus TaxID=36817 RepID=UPI001CE24EC2|nr:hypothetical protein [Streptomyces pseudogriseolus]
MSGQPGPGVPLDRLPLDDRLMLLFRGFAAEMTLLRAGALVWPTMNEEAEHRYGRVVAAQLAELTIRRYMWLSYDAGGGFVGPQSMTANRHPDAPTATNPEEALLLDVVFGGRERVRLAGRTDGDAWDRLSTLIHSRIKADGLACTRPARYRTLRLLLRTKRWMRTYAAAGPSWERAPELHLAGYPYAVLFDIENGPMAWPKPPDVDVHLPALLPFACMMAINAVPPAPGRI